MVVVAVPYFLIVSISYCFILGSLYRGGGSLRTSVGSMAVASKKRTHSPSFDAVTGTKPTFYPPTTTIFASATTTRRSTTATVTSSNAVEPNTVVSMKERTHKDNEKFNVVVLVLAIVGALLLFILLFIALWMMIQRRRYIYTVKTIELLWCYNFKHLFIANQGIQHLSLTSVTVQRTVNIA